MEPIIMRDLKTSKVCTNLACRLCKTRWSQSI